MNPDLSMPITRLVRFPGLLLGLVAISGCAGYQLGLDSLYRPDVKTVHVPIFQSDSYRRGLGEQLTEAVVKQIESRTPYKVVSASDADSRLNGAIVYQRKRVLAENSFDEPRDLETEIVVEVSWIDRQGDALMQRVVDPAAAVLPIRIGQAVNFVPESGQSLATAHQEAIQKLARQIVDQMELRW
ncbi:MAG: LPS assembly lipoprotein LptE [Pirellulaceae bacterium]